MSPWCRTLDEVVDSLKVSQNRRRRQLWKVGKLVQSLELDSAVQVGYEKRNYRKEYLREHLAWYRRAARRCCRVEGGGWETSPSKMCPVREAGVLAVECSVNISAHEQREANLEDEVDRVQETCEFCCTAEATNW